MSNEYTPSKADRIGIIIFMVVGVAIVVWSAIAAIGRIAEVLSGESIPVQAEFIGTEVSAPIGPGGNAVAVELDSATVTVSHLWVPAFSAVMQPVLLLLAATVLVICLLLLARNTLRGRIFSKTNTALVSTGGLTAIVGIALSGLFGNMAANDAIARISDGDFADYVVGSISPVPLVLGCFVFGIVATAYTVGAKIQRETEGLV